MADIIDERIAIIQGFLTLLALLAVFFSRQGKGYRKFSEYHSVFRFVFVILLWAHFMTAFLHVGLPRAGDPDAPIHLAILLLGLASAGMVGAMNYLKLRDLYWWLILLLVASHLVISYLHAGIWPA